MMMREDVAPALRRLGLKGSGQSYTLPSETHWALIGFQKFTWSNAGRVEFTINLTVARKDEWAAAYQATPHIGVRPSPGISGGPSWWARIGSLLPGGGNAELAETAWAVEPDEPVEPVAGDVVGAIRDHALPAMRERMR